MLDTVKKQPHKHIKSNAFSVILALIFVLLPTITSAQLIPYGARTQTTFWCNCMPGCVQINVGPTPRPAPLMYCPSTLLYSNYRLNPPVWRLGRAAAWMPCMIWYPGTPPFCAPAPAPFSGGLLMIQDGSSPI